MFRLIFAFIPIISTVLKRYDIRFTMYKIYVRQFFVDLILVYADGKQKSIIQ